MTKYYEFSTKKILSLDDMRRNYEEIISDGDTLLDSFEEYLETAIEWQDVIELDEYDLETLNSEKCYFCRDNGEIMTVSALRKCFDHDYMRDDYKSFEEWLSAQCAPWESLIEMN